MPRQARRPKKPLGCHDRALGLLAVRPRSRRELRDRLLRAGFEVTEVEDELARLQAVGLLDDERFARELADHAANVRRSGGTAIRAALFAKGVARETIDRTLEDLGDEEGRARHLAAMRAGRMRGLDPAAAFRRLVSLLIRRGYAGDVARRAAREALEVDARGDEV